LRQALNALADAAPEWLQTIAKPEWFPRYALRFESSREPTQPAARLQVSEAMGADGAELLEAVRHAPEHERLRQLPAVELLRQVWLQQFYTEHSDDVTAHVRLRAEADRPPDAQRIHSHKEDFLLSFQRLMSRSAMQISRKNRVSAIVPRRHYLFKGQ
jgi:transposase